MLLPDDWAEMSAEAQVAHLRGLGPGDLSRAVVAYDWTLHPERVLGWAMAQKGLDLGSAVCAFFNGGPERFNYMPKPHVPDQLRPVTRVLDNICLRINSGFYLVQPACKPKCYSTVTRWLDYQAEDRNELRRGRWILDEAILGPMLNDELCAPPEQTAWRNERPSLWRALLAPVIGLGVDRDILKYKEPRG
ncbi:hypothetical protein RA2_02087 [Roseovarius sp. A-2]|uniref:hypothetical protein n=1 Tax=Roseovarius sp. A-2 TaxID=1570360 RepID=UPI0009B541AB|nr:hypothetical protein [Roseovarius sp. A-2]GAW35029.1 hypothetical protein RA2_02087 [Roseovarius sp. A-2]